MRELEIVVHIEAEVVGTEESLLVLFAGFNVISQGFEVFKDAGDLCGLLGHLSSQAVVVFILVHEYDRLVLLVKLGVQLSGLALAPGRTSIMLLMTALRWSSRSWSLSAR